MTERKYADPPVCRNCGRPRPYAQGGAFCSEACFSAWLDRQDKAGLEHHVGAIKAQQAEKEQGQ